jgi:hypothetical protein
MTQQFVLPFLSTTKYDIKNWGEHKIGAPIFLQGSIQKRLQFIDYFLHLKATWFCFTFEIEIYVQLLIQRHLKTVAYK